jgi:predicted nucleic acid-binding protein
MRAVSNTSPLSNLAIIGRLELLKQRYGQVRIPPAVATELSHLSNEEALGHIKAALRDGWLVVEQLSAPLPQLAFPLDLGEHEAIGLALAARANVLLVDEKYGRAAARQVGLSVAGVLGELLHAKLQGRIPAVEPEVQKLRSQAGFYIDAPIERFILDQAGE